MVVQSDTAAQVVDGLCPHALACRITVASSSGTAGWQTLHDVVERAADMAPCPEHFASPSDDAILLFTSGTTSLPKPVVLTNTQQAGAENWAERFPWLATDYDAINICHHM